MGGYKSFKDFVPIWNCLWKTQREMGKQKKATLVFVKYTIRFWQRCGSNLKRNADNKERRRNEHIDCVFIVSENSSGFLVSMIWNIRFGFQLICVQVL